MLRFSTHPCEPSPCSSPGDNQVTPSMRAPLRFDFSYLVVQLARTLAKQVSILRQTCFPTKKDEVGSAWGQKPSNIWATGYLKTSFGGKETKETLCFSNGFSVPPVKVIQSFRPHPAEVCPSSRFGSFAAWERCLDLSSTHWPACASSGRSRVAFGGGWRV